MQSQKPYPIEHLLDFLEPSFLERIGSRNGFAGNALLLSLGNDGIVEVQKLVRRFIEEWISSGFNEKGEEWPYRRSFAPRLAAWEDDGKPAGEAWEEDSRPILEPAPAALKAMEKYLGGSLRVVVPRCGEASYLLSASRNVLVSVKERGGVVFELSDTLPEWSRSATDSEIEQVVQDALKQAAADGIEQVSEDEIRREIRRSIEEDLRNLFEHVAAGLFLCFYRSEWLFKLMQCRHCRSFDVLNKHKPRKSYVRGWHCPKCSRTVSATLAVEKSRVARRKVWFDLAVKALQEWDTKPRKADHVAWITERVNEGLPKYLDHIKRNTITRNLTEIEEHAREDKHAES
jgi:hypothetical protein